MHLSIVWIWGIVFFVILLTVNVFLFICHRKTEPEHSWWAQFWKYCGTDAFKAVTISLLIPLILAIMGGIFKIGNVLEERIRSDQEQRTEMRWECVQLTADMWNELYSLTSEVRYFQRGDNEEERIKDLLKRLEDFSSKGEDIINEWDYRFPNLSANDRSLMLYFENILLHSSSSVAYYIQKGDDDIVISKLQYELDVIQAVIKNNAHHSILSILKYSVDFLREDINDNEKANAKANIEFQLNYLRECSDAIDKEIGKYTTSVPDLKGDKADIFQEYVIKAKDWQQNNREKSISDWAEYKDFFNLFYEIPYSDYGSTWDVAYSKDNLEHLSKFLNFRSLLKDIEKSIKE